MGWLLRKPSLSWFRQAGWKQRCQAKSVWQWEPLAFAEHPLLQQGASDTVAYDRVQTERRLKPYKVTVVLPIYNEQACINETFDAVLEYARYHPTYQFIFVNDGSVDQTQQRLESRLAHCQTEQMTLASYTPCRGKGHAVKTGVALGAGDYVCFLDSDLAYSLDHLDRLLDELKEADIVIGCRNLLPGGAKGVHPTRRLAGRVFNLLSQWILALNFSDMQAGIKGFRMQTARRLFAKQVLTGFSFDVELVYLAKKQGCQIGEIPVSVSMHHAQKTSNVHLLKDSLRMLLDLFRIRYYDMTKRYD
ncbi:glycosyltransferase [Stenomitos frigidus]|uniref:Glycosyl transferase n=1 Tax=Stenomitos frigidus ULC18 TaxID=2107698 RepID=A0A2T1EI78_9CYAN|nr:glycosyltransferase [Stenomitos frigidus]PSB32456.1 glycosyl transferase [Stenomitos frigidus ULC18]